MKTRLDRIKLRMSTIKKRQAELRSDADNVDNAELEQKLEEVKALDEELKELEEEVKELKEDENTDDTATEQRSKMKNILSSIEKRGRAIEKPIGSIEERSLGIDSKEYRSAFFKHFAGVELNEVEKRAMTTNKSSAGVAVPTITMNKIYEKIENDSIVYGLVTRTNLKGNVVIPIEKTTNDVQRLAEGESGTVVEDTLDELRLSAKKYIKLVTLTCELENTSIDALESFVVGKLAKKLMQAVDYDIINGDGQKCAKGILETITATDTKTAGELTLDDILTLFASIPATARKNATLMMSTKTLYLKVKSLKDTQGRPIFDVHENKVLGVVPVECDDVPEGVIIYGDFSEYMFNWSKDAVIEKSKEVEFKSGDSVFRILALADGGLMDLGAMAVLDARNTTPVNPPSGADGSETETNADGNN